MEIKGSFEDEYKKRLKLVLKSRLDGKNKITTINIWAGTVLRYATGIIAWAAELKELDRSTRRMMTMNGALHPKGDVL